MKMKKIALVTLILLLSLNSLCFATESPQAYMEITTTDGWHIYTKNMQDEALLSAVEKSTEEINDILEKTGSESVIINEETGAQVYVKVKKNEKTQDLWNISDTDNSYIKENIKTIVYDAFLMGAFNYQDEDVTIDDYAYLKLVTVPGSAYYDEDVHGVVCGGTVVNGSAIVFTMITENNFPTEEEIKAVKELAKGVSFTVIKEKENTVATDKKQEESDVFHYILGGFGALVLVIFCAYMIVRMKNKEE